MVMGFAETAYANDSYRLLNISVGVLFLNLTKGDGLVAASLGIILILGIGLKKIFEKCKLPGLLGMLVLGMAIGPYGLDLLSGDLLIISADLRRLALIIILLRAGLGIDKKDLQKHGFSSIKMASIPAIIEGFFIVFASVRFLGFTFVEGGILGFVIAAVSPAIVVPSMLRLIENKVGEAKAVPALILAGASLDDVFAITIFTVFLGLYQDSNINIATKLLAIPLSILLAILIGILLGLVLVKTFKKFNLGGIEKLLLLLGGAILLTELETLLKGKIELAALLGVMALGFVIRERAPSMGEKLSAKLNGVWEFAQILLFVLVGAEVNLGLAIQAGKIGILIISLGLLGRSIGVLISLLGSDLNWKERLFCVISYIPKATVQAAMGGFPLSLGLASGDIILALAVLSIVITAPLGAIGIDYSAKRLL